MVNKDEYMNIKQKVLLETSTLINKTIKQMSARNSVKFVKGNVNVI